MPLVPAECPICEVDDCVPLAVGNDFEYGTSTDEFLAVQCRGCELVYLNPRPDDAGLARAYPDHYHAFQFDSQAFGLIYRVRQRLEARRLLGWCRGLSDQARILDIGCGDGFHLELLRRFGPAGWTLEGVDVDARAAAGAARRGVSIHCGRAEELPLERAGYDRVLMIMTIEHVPDPLRSVARAAELLRPGGRLIIVTDNTRSPDAWLFGNRHWGGFHFPRHLHLFDPTNLTALCRKAGLDAVRVSTAMSPVNWTYSMRNWIQDWGGPRWLSNFFSLQSPLALAAFTALDGPLSLVGRGGILHGVFEKPRQEAA